MDTGMPLYPISVKFACLVLVVFVGELLMTFGMVGGIVYSSFHTEAREII